MDTQRSRKLAEELIAAHLQRTQYRRYEGSVADGYAVQRVFQDLCQTRLGRDARAGYKIALTSVAMQTMVGVSEPLAGWVFADRVFAPDVDIHLADFQHLGVEFEVAVGMGKTLAARADGQPHTRASVADAVDGYATAYEFVEDRNADYSEINAFSVIAENSWNAGVMIGDYHPIVLSADAKTALKINGTAAGTGVAGDALGHPLEAVAWLANMLNQDGESLKAGEFVMTGSSMRTTFPSIGDKYEFCVDGLGCLRTQFT
jgi:2-keto-4-pentenoate hydratase